MRLAIITLSLIFTVLMVALTDWFEIETRHIEQINKEHLAEIQRLRKISKINMWLDKTVAPHLKILPRNAEHSDKNLVEFFDKYANDLHFVVNKYIYTDKETHNLDVQFSIKRENKDSLGTLMKIRYPKGFLQFNNFEFNKKNVKGELRFIQPFYGDSNASNK